MCIYYEIGTCSLDCGRKWCVSEYNLGQTLTVIICYCGHIYSIDGQPCGKEYYCIHYAQRLLVNVSEYPSSIPEILLIFFVIFFPIKTQKINNSPRLCIEDSQIGLYIGQYLDILVLEYQFDIQIFRHFFELYIISKKKIE